MTRRVIYQMTFSVLFAIAPFAALGAEADIEGFEFSCRFSDGTALKPKFGDIEGVLYTDLPAQREQCLEAVQRKIALCEQNINFESNTENQEHADCLPEFEKQAKACIGHFHFERGKCDAGGIQQIEQEEESDYVVDAVDREMEVVKRANVRSGPGTEYDVIATIDGGFGIRVTGEVQGLNWVRVDVLEGGGEAFIYAPLLKERDLVSQPAPEEVSETASQGPMEPFGWDWTIVENQPCQIYTAGWTEAFANSTWSGGCVDGKASGQGRLITGDGAVYDGEMLAGKRHGYGVVVAEGYRFEGEWRDGLPFDGIQDWIQSTYTSSCEFRQGKLTSTCEYKNY